MRVQYEQKLDVLNDNLTDMAYLCTLSLTYSMKAFFSEDENEARENATKCHEAEANVNLFEEQIQQQSILLLLKEQPMASDLRFISAAMSMNVDLERISDYGEDISRIVFHLLGKFDPGKLDDLKKMSEITVSMVADSVRSYVEGDSDLAVRTAQRDDQVDDLFVKVSKEIVEEIRRYDASDADSLDSMVIVNLLLVAKYLERAADHATNICESVIFAVTGNTVKFQ